MSYRQHDTKTGSLPTETLPVEKPTENSTMAEAPAVAPIALSLPVQQLTLEGLPVWYLENTDVDLVCIRLVFTDIGAAYDKKNGISKLFSHMMTEGTESQDGETFKNELLKNRISLSITSDNDHFYIAVKTVHDKLDKAALILKDILGHLRLDPKDMERIRKEIIFDMEEDQHHPKAIASDVLEQFAFVKHPYFETYQQYLKDLSSLTIDDLREIPLRFGKNRLQCTFVGHINISEVEQFLRVATEELPAQSCALPEVPALQYQNEGKVHYHFMDVPQSVIRFVLPAVDRLHPDYYALFVLNQILGAPGFISRFFKDIRDKKGLAYSIASGLVMDRKGQYIKGFAGISPENVEQVIQSIRQEFTRLQQELVDDDELSLQKKYQSGRLALGFDSLWDTASTLAWFQLSGLSPEFIQEWPTIMASLTPEKLKEVAERYLSADRITFVVVGKHAA